MHDVPGYVRKGALRQRKIGVMCEKVQEAHEYHLKIVELHGYHGAIRREKVLKQVARTRRCCPKGKKYISFSLASISDRS